MASTKPVTNSIRNRPLAARSSLIASSLHCACRKCAVLDDSCDDHNHGKRQRKKHFPAKPHELIVAIAWNHRLCHGEQEKHEERLEREPDHAWYPGKRRIGHRRQPAAEKQ